jgi:hypothetical protein
VYIHGFNFLPTDIRAPIEIKDLTEYMKQSNVVEAYWISASKSLPRGSSPKYDCFLASCKADSSALMPGYLNKKRYARLKFFSIKVSFLDSSLGFLFGDLEINLNVLIHASGVGVATATLRVAGKGLTTDQVIKLRKDFSTAKCNIKDLEKTYFNVSLEYYINTVVVRSILRALCKVYHKDEDQLTPCVERYIKNRKAKIIWKTTILSVWEFECDNCPSIDEAIKNHIKEFAAIATGFVKWKDYRIDAAQRDLGENLSNIEYVSYYVMIDGALHVTSKSRSFKDYEEILSDMIDLIAPIEFLYAVGALLDIYSEYANNTIANTISKYHPSENINIKELDELIRRAVGIRDELAWSLREYYDFNFIELDPSKTIFERGKERNRFTEWVEILGLQLDGLSKTIESLYDLERTRRNDETNRLLIFLGILTLGQLAADVSMYLRFSLQAVLVSIVITVALGFGFIVYVIRKRLLGLL